MLFFIAVFTAAVAWALARRRRAHYERMSSLPLDGDADRAGSER
jgi:cbb3-type cytochrome oxidase subunit 3